MNDKYAWNDHWASQVIHFVHKATSEVLEEIRVEPLNMSHVVYTWNYRKFVSLELLKKIIEGQYEPN